MHKDRLGEWGSLKLVFLHKTPVYEHPSCSGIQECRCGDRCKRGEGGELNLDVVDGEVIVTMLLILNPPQLKKPWSRTKREAESCEVGPPNDQTRTMMMGLLIKT